MARPGDEGAEGSKPVVKQGSLPAGVDPEQRALDVRLRKLSRSTFDKRRRATAAAFDLAEECAALAETVPKKELVAFLQQECELSRSAALAILKLPALLGAHRGVLEERAVGDEMLLRLVREPEAVRSEIVAMLRAGRDMSDIDLRALRRDVLAGEEMISAVHASPALKDLKRAVRVRAKDDVAVFQRDLLALTNAFAALYNHTLPEDRSPLTQQRVETLASEADRLLRMLIDLVPVAFLDAGSEARETNWSTVRTVLRHLAAKRLSLEEDWRWPETDPLWMEAWFYEVLVWGLGQEQRPLPGRRVSHGRSGAVPLDRLPRAERFRPSKPYRFGVLELCAGAGGQALGLHAAGFHHVALVEQDRDAVATLRHNEPRWPVVEADITKHDFSQYRGVDVLAGGLPCQPYSAAGEKRGAADERDLFERALEIIAEVRPRVVVIENVTAILHITHAERRRVVYAALADLGYESEWRILSARDFGMAQNRRRAILVAMDRSIAHRFRWPVAGDIPKQTLGEALHDLMASGGWKSAARWAELACGYAPTIIGGSKKKLGLDLAQQTSREAWRKLHVDPNYVEELPPGPDFEGMPRLTNPMLARLQDFPDSWQFTGSRKEQFHQIANAFPPRMARMIGLSIQRALTGEEIDLDAAVGAPLTPSIDIPWLNHLEAQKDRHEMDQDEPFLYAAE